MLEKIHSSNDVKALPEEDLVPLCGELRSFLVESLSKTGGHLASNLGAVELTVALHRVYDTAKDRLVFDVGHQSYVHKILTGRRDRFDTLRQYGGISGFPKPRESADDAFIAGHASDSVSVALGMARARTLLQQDQDVVAVIGDGALTGGLAYEGLTAAAASKEPLVIVLNDNNMSIDPNVGGMASLLQDMRVKPGYFTFKRLYREVFAHVPPLYRFNHDVKEWVKAKILPDNILSALGLEYMGPVDGHDVHQMESVFRWAKELRRPVLVHVLTKKGKGCPYAEAHPELYHGVGPFDPVTGELKSCGRAFSDVFGQSLLEFGEKDSRIVAITAAMASGTGLDRFAERFPTRFVDAGIAEGHATSFAAGMAKQGMLPVFAVYSSFLQRGYDMLIHDVSLLGLHVVFGVDRAGIVGGDGETHHGIFDVDYLRSVPGMQIWCPGSFPELRNMLEEALFHMDGPVAIRYPRGGEGFYHGSHLQRECVLRHGDDVTLVCYGTMVNECMKAAELLEEHGVHAELIKLGLLSAGTYPTVLESLRKTGRIVMAEEACAAGSVGRELLAQAEQDDIALQGARLLDLGAGIVPHGDRALLMRDFGIDARSIVGAALELCGIEAET
ncbi:MAG: 1-deoxy-D-xylulose-5-phosphate synthase [Oscillospiraceae bacterium]|nr:1-deoxy-D-xylulose-5-phosphate synthase [Oscillospiraceae bacterium]